MFPTHECSALRALYPEYRWDELKFQKPKEYWKKKVNQRSFFNQLAKKLSIMDQLQHSQDSLNAT